MLASFRENLRRELELRDGDMQGFSTTAGLGKTFVRDIVKRGRDPQLSYVYRLAAAHGLSLDQMLGLRSQARHNADAVKVVGVVGAGLWHEVSASDFKIVDSALPADPRFPPSSQFDLVVRGSSINRFARDGEHLRCVDLVKSGVDFADSDLVIFEKLRDGGHLAETTAKRIRRRGPMIELWPDSDDPRWQQPERLDTRRAREGEEGRVVALVLYSYNPAGHAHA